MRTARVRGKGIGRLRGRNTESADAGGFLHRKYETLRASREKACGSD
jgi:hypothetical protein